MDGSRGDSQDGNGVVAEGFDFFLPGRFFKVRWVAPAVVVEGKEVATFVISTAVEVLGGLNAIVI